MILFNGKQEALQLENTIKSHLKINNATKKMLIVLIGDDPSSEMYIKLKQKLAEKLGIQTHLERIDANLNDEIIFDKVKKLFNDENVSGGIIQLPLPRESLKKALNLIPLDKDLDSLSDTKSLQLLQKNQKLLSPTLRAFSHFLLVAGIKTYGLSTAVIGAGDLVGQPITRFLLLNGAKVTILDDVKKVKTRFSPDLKNFQNLVFDSLYTPSTKLNYDLLVLCTGIPNLIKGEDIKANCNVVDFGSAIVNGRSTGDLDYTSKLEHLGCISPSPGGMGPLVTRYMIMNFLGI